MTHHRRKTDGPLTTRGPLSRITTFRLPYEIEDAIKEVAAQRGQKWQTVLKDLLAEALGLETSSGAEVKRIPASALQAAAKRLKRPKTTGVELLREALSVKRKS